MPRRPLILGLLLLAGLHLAAAAWVAVPGWISIDEGVYHLMAEAMSRGGHAIENGYGAFPSDELTVRIEDMDHHIQPVGDRLVAQYPAMATVVAMPLYLLEGYPGLFRSNTLAFLLAVALCFWVGRVLYPDDRGAAWVAAGSFALCSFAWGYAVGSWPHMVHIAAVLGAMGAVLLAIQREGRTALLAAAGGGLVLGLDLGVRLDGLFVGGVIGLVLLFQPRVRWREGLAFGLGVLPGLLFLSLTNHAKFGVWSPLSYGPAAQSNIAGYLPAVAPGLLVVAARAVVFRSAVRRAFLQRRGWFVTAAILAPLGLLLLPGAREPLLRWAAAAWALAVDLRVDALGKDRGGILPSPGGGVYYYIGGFKKALVQSLPWFALILVPLRDWLRGRREQRFLPALLLVPLVLVVVYSQKGRHGGLCLNQRYLLPALPLMALAIAPALRDLLTRLRGRWAWLALPAVTAASAALVPTLGEIELSLHERLILDLPLLLAVTLAGSLILGWLPSLSEARWLHRTQALIAVAALAWGGLVCFGYDVPIERRARARTLDIATTTAEALPERSLLLVDWCDPFFGLMAEDRVVLATPGLDGGEDLPRLVEHFRAEGWPVHAAFGKGTWEQLVQLPFMQGYRVEPVTRMDALLLGRLEPQLLPAP